MFEGVGALLLITSPILWILTSVVFAFIVWAIEWEKGIVATVILAAFLTLFYFFGSGGDLVTWIKENPYGFLESIAVYVAIGIVWATGHWVIRCRERVNQYHDLLREWSSDNRLPYTGTVPPALRNKWLNFLCGVPVGDKKYRWCSYSDAGKERVYTPSIKMRAWAFKVDITRWMMWWPASMFWWLLHGFILGFYARLQRWLGGFYNWLSDIIFRHIDEDLNKPLPKEEAAPVKTSKQIVCDEPPYVR